MPKSRGRKVKSNKKKMRRADRPTFIPDKDVKYISIEQGPVSFLNKVTGVTKHKDNSKITVESIPVQDTIRPISLNFDPPLRSFGIDQTCFDYQWQQLTYLFNLNDPKKFPNISSPLSGDDKQLLARYFETCRNLAGYSIINSKSRLTLSSKGGTWTANADLPSHQEFSGFSATFRQLHNDGESASFMKAWKIVNRSLNMITSLENELADSQQTLKEWKVARARLKEKAAATLICEKLNPNIKDEHPRTLKGVVPEDLIKTFNYGDTLHWGENREALADLTSDPLHANYYKFCCVRTMTSLSHLYFGFAVLVAAALGARR